MSRHAGPRSTVGPDPESIPEPGYAERARTLVHRGRTGTLSTLSRRHPGHPFGSVMPYAPDSMGRPLLLISSMAVHTHNLSADSRASLLIPEPGWAGDPLAAARVTLLGSVDRLPAAEVPTARSSYLERHPSAAHWVDFDDFGFHRLEPADVYYVGGFGVMDWVATLDYRSARPDPLADSAPSILEHMNRDHADALLLLARVLGKAPADAATMTAVDRLGFRLRVRSGDRLQGLRLAFPREVWSAESARSALIEMIQVARRSG